MKVRPATVVKALLVVIVLAGCVAVFLAVVGDLLVRNQQMSTLSNMKQLQLASQQMALDRESGLNTNGGWPGDTGGTFSNWTAQLLEGDYLSRNDLAKVFSAPGVVATTNDLQVNSGKALLVYAVSKSSSDTVVFLSTANFTNTPTAGIVNPTVQPYGKRGFVVMKKDGNGAILSSHPAGQTNLIGGYAPLCQ